MSNPSTNALKNPTVDEIISSVNLNDFNFVGNYGRLLNSDAVNQALDISMTSPSTVLAEKLQAIVEKLNVANPSVLQETPTYWQKVTGSHLAKVVRFEAINKTADQLISEASELAEKVAQLANSMRKAFHEHEHEMAFLRVHIEAGERYLAEHPATMEKSVLDIESPGERFRKRIQNLKALLASKEMHSVQIKLVIAQAIDIVERFCQVRDVLVPVWLHYVQKLKYGVNNNPELIDSAHRAQEALVKGLSDVLNSKNQAIGA